MIQNTDSKDNIDPTDNIVDPSSWSHFFLIPFGEILNSLH